MLQALIQDVMGMTVPELDNEIIFEPIDMRHSSFAKPLPETLRALTTSAHTNQGEPRQGHQFLQGGSICCGLWTTSEDLAKFTIEIQRAVRGDMDAILSPDMARAMLTPTNSDRMGLGFVLEQHDNSTYFSHGGGNPPGFTCFLIAHKDAGYGAVVMTNSNNGVRLYREIIRAIADTYQWQDY